MKPPIRGLTALLLAASAGLSTTASASLTAQTGVHAGTVAEDNHLLLWLQNANLAQTQTFSVTGINANGTMTWAKAQEWIAALNAANYGGYHTWRLPDADVSPGATNSSSEMGYLYYTELGASFNGGFSSAPSLAPFTPTANVKDNLYWNAQDAGGGYAWAFDGSTGTQATIDKTTARYVWAVTSVPIPAAVWLFGSALAGLGIISRRKSPQPA